MKTTLVIMAAGLGTRYGRGIKQLEAVGPSGEIIMDYSIHDAVEAGFNKIIFIIRKEIEQDFQQVIGSRIRTICAKRNVEVAYAMQDLEDLPEGFRVPEGRKKPWGTGAAILACRDMLTEPFAVINADDYYGKRSFVKLHEFLISHKKNQPYQFCMAGFRLIHTLSANGGVTRGICKTDTYGCLTELVETSHLVRTPEGAAVEETAPDGTASYRPVDAHALVSMNMWGFTPEFVELLKQGFVSFLRGLTPQNEMDSEFLIPIFVGELLRQQKIQVVVLQTDECWFGVTYHEDTPGVRKAFRKLIAEGVYREKLFSDWD